MRGDITLLHMLAPVHDALAHPQVTDIVVNKPYQVIIRRAGSWEIHAVPSFSFEALDAMTILIGQRMGREFDEGHPYVNSTMPGGQRFQGIRPPGTMDGRILWAIRRPPTAARRLDDPDFDDLTAETNQGTSRRRRSREAINAAFEARKWREVIRIARLSGMSIAFCGATGGGKTDLVRRAIGANQGARMVSIETDDELGEVGPENKAPMFYDTDAMTADEAVRIALRLIPKEIVLQEVRGPEAYSMLRAANSGHSIVTTWHADEGKELESVCMMARQHPAGREMERDELAKLASDAFDVIAYCEFNDEKNKYSIASIKLIGQEADA